MLIGQRKACFVFASLHKVGRSVFRSVRFVAILAFLAPVASAGLCGYNPLRLTFNSTYSGGACLLTYYGGKKADCDLLGFRHDDIAGDSEDGNNSGAGSDLCPDRDATECATEQGPTCERGAVSVAMAGNENGADSSAGVSTPTVKRYRPPDFNRAIFFKHKLEFSQDVGWLPINIPFPFDFLLSAQYQLYPLKYTLVPLIGSVRWQLGDIHGPLFLRGNWDVEASLGVVAIPRGPETHYFTYIMGMRRNFVPRNSRVTPYFDWRAGLGYIDAKGPLGVQYAQGQDFTFTLNMGSGVRYNFNPRYAVTAGVNWMHISNANLSEHKYDASQHDPWGVENFGINVVGPMFGVDIQLGKHRHSAE